MEEATAIDKIRNAVEIATKKLIIVNDRLSACLTQSNNSN